MKKVESAGKHGRPPKEVAVSVDVHPPPPPTLPTLDPITGPDVRVTKFSFIHGSYTFFYGSYAIEIVLLTCMYSFGSAN
jgi:hypothetical protein